MILKISKSSRPVTLTVSQEAGEVVIEVQVDANDSESERPLIIPAKW